MTIKKEIKHYLKAQNVGLFHWLFETSCRLSELEDCPEIVLSELGNNWHFEEITQEHMITVPLFLFIADYMKKRYHVDYIACNLK